MGEADDNPEIGGDKAIFVIAYDIAVFQQVERQFQRFVLSINLFLSHGKLR